MIDKTLNNEEKIFGIKIDNVEYFEREAVYGIFITSEGKVAVIQTPGGYFLPGGGIEEGENHVQCLEREFCEETGYKIIVKEFIGKAALYHTSKTMKYIRGIGFFYSVELKDKEDSKIEKDHELVWLGVDECIKGLFLEHQAWAVKKMLKA
jgi:8-oxo-dGTP diphosphatase